MPTTTLSGVAVSAGRLVAGPVAAALLAAGLLAATLAPGAVPPVRAADGVSVSGETTLTVQPQRRRVLARVDLRIRNESPSTTSGGVTTDWFVREWSIAVPDEAERVRVADGGRSLPTTVRERDGYDLVEFDLRPDLAYRQAADLRITYELPDGGARSASEVRVGRAYLSFYAFAHGDDDATLRISVPAGFEVQTLGGPITVSATTDGGTLLTTDGSVDDQTWYVVVTGERPDALRVETLEVDIDGEPRVVHVRSWPEDDLWADRVRERLASGLVALHELHGLDWPVVGPLRVTESASRSLEGYAGLYDPGESGALDEITIGEEPDELVIVHEAAHAWFNDGLLTGRWIGEGLAEAYAALALERLGSTPPALEPVDRNTRVAFALDLWGPPERIDSERAQARETYAYDASRFVFDALLAEIGAARMREVLAAAADQAIAFQGAPATETHTRLTDIRDWRYLLDLLEQVGGSEGAAELFGTWVVSDPERPSLADHEAALRRYRHLVARAEGWRPGLALRSQMARWAFLDVDRQLDLAGTALDRREAIEAREAALGLDDGGALRSAWESVVVSYDRVVGQAEEQLETVDAVAAARAAVDAERDPLATLGLFGADTAADLAAAEAAYRVGHLAEARDEAAQAMALIDGADAVGRQRATLIGAAGLLVLVGGGAILVIGRRRRASARRLVSEPASEPRSGVDAPEAPATLAARAEPAAPEGSGEAGAAEGDREP